MNIKSVLSQATSQLSQLPTAQLDAQVLLAYILRVDRSYFVAWPEKELSVQQQQSFDALVQRRASGEPVAYLLGEKEFWGLTLKVSQHTLIPRPETELLVEMILKHFSADKQLKVLDLGTGSGAIALALASEEPNWQLVAVDYSLKALEVAKDNARQSGISNVSFKHSNWYDSLGLLEKFDVIVSNPPYIAENDAHLTALAYEPRSALVADDQGLSDIALICQGAKQHLCSNGMLLIEHGFAQAKDVQGMMRENHFTNIETVSDLAGLPRVTTGQYMAPML